MKTAAQSGVPIRKRNLMPGHRMKSPTGWKIRSGMKSWPFLKSREQL